MKMRATLTGCVTALALASAPAAAAAADEQAVLDTYMAIGAAGYADSLATARTLAAAVDRLVAEPSEKTLDEARDAWIAARVPYQQTEVFRFGNAIVDDWEGRVNSWPLDEGLIDYVAYGGATDENPYAGFDIVASPTLVLSGHEIDATTITPALIGELNELDGIEANVTRGYHAIEFMLWGQDLNGTDAGNGDRPATDYDKASCTNGNCERRAQYLKAATDLLVSDLAEMAETWAPGGAARQELQAKGADGGIGTILTGMGSLSYGEQAGERMKLGLLLNDPEEEHDCFSDNTHNSHFYDGLGVRNVYLGRYVRVDGVVIEGPSVAELVAGADPEIDARLRDSLNDTMMALTSIKVVAEAGTSYDRLLAPGNAAGEALIQAAIDALVAQTREIERAVAALELQPIALEGSDSLDNPGAVFQ